MVFAPFITFQKHAPRRFEPIPECSIIPSTDGMYSLGMGRQGSLESNSARRAPGSDLQGRIDRLKNKTRSSFKVSSATSDRFSMTKFNRQRFSRRLDGIELKENLVVARKGVERDQHVQNDDGAQNILHLIFHFPEVDGLPRCVYAGPGTPVSGGLAYIRCNSGLHSARQVDQDRIIKIELVVHSRARKPDRPRANAATPQAAWN
jgi:hypothetical protein